MSAALADRSPPSAHRRRPEPGCIGARVVAWVVVKPRWVDVVAGQTCAVNIVGGNEIKMSPAKNAGSS